MTQTEGWQSLERYINRRRLFVRVQANVNRELFIQKLNAAFPGARIGVGTDRGPVTQRIADISYDSAAEATQALRRTRFKLKVGNHDADITYQIERKDVVEKLAGEWGCRFMVVVKNLPPGEVSCSELSELFESVGEIFTIKVLPGNRGEPYALVQFVEEQSVDLSIQQINQQKLHGAVLYVERHLKARRPGVPGQTPAAAQPSPAAAAAAAAPTPTSPQASAANHTSRAPTAAAAVAAGLHAQPSANGHAAGHRQGSNASGGQSKAAAAAAAAAASQSASQSAQPQAAAAPAAPAASSQPAAGTQPAAGGPNGSGAGHTLPTAVATTAPAASPSIASSSSATPGSIASAAHAATDASSQSGGSGQQHTGGVPPSPASTVAGPPLFTALPMAAAAAAPQGPMSPTADAPPSRASLSSAHSIENSNSLFSLQYGGTSAGTVSRPETTGLYSSSSLNGVGSTSLGALGQPALPSAAPHLGLFSPTEPPLGGGNGKSSYSSGTLASSPTSLLGPSSAVVGGPALGGVPSLLGSSMPSLTLGLGAPTASHQVLTPMLDLFSHLREPQGSVAPGSSPSAEQLPNGAFGGNGGGNGGSKGSDGVFSSKPGSYAGLLARQPSTQLPGGNGGPALLSPTAQQATSGAQQLMSAPSGGLLGTLNQPPPGYGASANGGPPASMPQHGVGGGTPLSPHVSQQLPDALSPHALTPLGGRPVPPPLQVPGASMGTNAGLTAGLGGMGMGLPAGLASPGQQVKQHGVGPGAHAAAHAGGVPHGAGGPLPRISIRDSLRLALGRLEELVTCPLTGDIMRDPVVAADGYSYERAAIQAWLVTHGAISPVSREALQHKMLIPNQLAKDVIADILPSS